MTNFGSYYWLGKPGGRTGMLQLPRPNTGTQIPMTRGEQPHDLISGGTTVFHGPLSHRQYVFQRDWLTPTDEEILRGLYTGALDTGPFKLYDPSEVNLLGQDASTFGRYTSDLSYWGTTNCLLATDPDVFGDISSLSTKGSNQVAISSLVNGCSLNSQSALEPLQAVPALPNIGGVIKWSFSIFAFRSAGTGAPTLQPYVKGASTVSGSAVALTGAITRYSVSATASSLGTSSYIDCGVTFPVAGSGTIVKLFAPQLEIALSASPYRLGLGVANVVFSGGLSQVVPRTKSHSTGWTLVEF